MTELSEYVTASVIAKQHNIGYRTVLERIHRKKIETFKLGNVIAIKAEDAALVCHKPYKGERK